MALPCPLPLADAHASMVAYTGADQFFIMGFWKVLREVVPPNNFKIFLR